MSDRELLQDAAKAAGYTLRQHYEGFPPIAEELNAAWNPITDDGDALRLAVKLRLAFCMGFDQTWISTESHPTKHVYFENHDDDPYAATRRAIVCVAAEIGRSMK